MNKNYLDSETFCVAPFVHLSTKTDGSIKACCQSLPPIANINSQSLLEAWNNDDIKLLRHDLLNGVKNEKCNLCWQLEKAGSTSLREKYNRESTGHLENAKIAIELMKDDYSIPVKPKWIEFKLSNLCNFKCRMCHPMDSTKWFDDYKKISHIHDTNWQQSMIALNLENKPSLKSYSEEFFDSLPEILSEVTHLWFAGGEPLYDDNHYRILDLVKDRAHLINLNYATNLSMLSFKKNSAIDYWKNFKKVNLSVSLDGPKKLNEYIRSGADSDGIENNIKTALSLLPNVVLHGKITVQALNIFYIPEALEWFKNMGVNVGVHYVTWPKFLDSRIWTGEPRQIILSKLTNHLKELKKFNDPISKSCSNALKDALAFFEAKDLYNEEVWSKFLEYNKILDAARNESFNEFEFLKQWMK